MELRQAQLPEELAIEVLIERCHAETAAFFARRRYDAAVCLELLRRAIALREEAACAGVCEVYGALITGWVEQQISIKHTHEEPQWLVNQSFMRFFRGLRPQSLATMNLAQALGYLRRCAVTTVIDAGRRGAHRLEEVSAAPLLSMAAAGLSVEEDVLSQLAAAELFELVWARCVDDRERVVAIRSLWQGWSPREIAAEHGDLFPTVEAVYRRRGVLRERLRRQQQAIGWANAWVSGW